MFLQTKNVKVVTFFVLLFNNLSLHIFPYNDLCEGLIWSTCELDAEAEISTPVTTQTQSCDGQGPKLEGRDICCCHVSDLKRNRNTRFLTFNKSCLTLLNFITTTNFKHQVIFVEDNLTQSCFKDS